MIKYIVVHCSASPHRGEGAGTINRWHIERGFDGIGYHFVIDEYGEIANGRPIFPDTKEIWKGAHVMGHNGHSIGICLMGDYAFTKAQQDALRRQVDYLKAIFPEAEVVGHNDLDSKKTCPNFDVKHWFETNEFR